MSRILLVNSPEQRCRVVAPNLGLSYLDAYLACHGHNVDILDCRVHTTSLEQKVHEFSPDMIGFGVHSHERQSVLALASIVRGHDNGIPIVFGGIHPTVCPADYLFDESTFVVRGEGEETLLELINALSNGKQHLEQIRGLSFREGGTVAHNPVRDLIPDVDILPVPSVYKYFGAPKINQFQMMLARGCYYGCTFCSSETVWGRRWRQHTPNRIITEIDRFVANGISEFVFADDSLTLHPAWSTEIAEQILARGYNICTPINSRVDFHKRFSSEHEATAYLTLVRRAGGTLICYGVETGSQPILDRTKKSQTVEDAVKAICLAKNAGMAVKINLLVGLPGSFDEQLQTIHFLQTLDPHRMPDYVSVRYFTPFQGTRIRDRGLFGMSPVGEALDYDARTPQVQYTNTEFTLTVGEQEKVMQEIVSYLQSVGYSTTVGKGMGIMSSPLTDLSIPNGSTAYAQVSKCGL